MFIKADWIDNIKTDWIEHNKTNWNWNKSSAQRERNWVSS